MRKVNWSPNKGINLKNIFKNFLWKKKKKKKPTIIFENFDIKTFLKLLINGYQLTLILYL